MDRQNPQLSQILFDVSRNLVANLALDELLPMILDQLARVVNYTSSSIMLLEGETLRPVAQRSAFARDLEPLVVQVSALQHLRTVIEQRTAVVISDTQTDPRWLPRASNAHIRSWVGAPLVVHDRVIGMLNLTHEEPQHYGAEQLEVATSFGVFAAIAIENACLYEQAQREIAERIAAEQKLQEEQALLTERVAEQTADLRAANKEMALAVRHKDEFLAAMSHELRTPLNTILGMSELLLENAYGALNERQHRSVSNIQRSGKTLLARINDILDLARMAAGQLRLDWALAAVEDICRSSINQVQGAAQAKQIEVDYVRAPEVTALYVDARRVLQILVNLLNNAVKFSAEGAHVGLTVAGAADRATVEFTVWDTGIGIGAADRDRLFQPFVQLDGSLARRYEGAGLGLAIVHHLVDLHDGSVDVQSEPGQGSRFIVSLPWQTEPPAPVAGHKAPPAAAHRILLVSANAVTVKRLQYYLEAAGFIVEVAQNGYRALEIAAQRLPALILTDLFLPDLDGLATTQQIRHSERLHRIPVVAISALNGPWAEQRCLAAGASAVLFKPVDRALLQRTVTTLTENEQ